MKSARSYWLMYCITFVFAGQWGCVPPNGMENSKLSVVSQQVHPSLSEKAQMFERLDASVGKVISVAFYMTYYFDKSRRLVPRELNDSIFRNVADETSLSNQSVSGTAWVVYKDQDILGFITCAHVVDFSDTLYSYYADAPSYLLSVSLKLRQKIYVSGISNSGELTIAALDKESDIALLKKEIAPDKERPPLVQLPLLSEKSLQWATPLYIFGYPKGKKLVTTAIATKPSSHNRGFFTTDAVFNRGMSGAPVVAVSDVPPYFRLAGMASSAFMEKIQYLQPDVNNNKNLNNSNIYTGKAVVNTASLINYGMTTAVSADALLRFIRENRERLAKEGFSPEYFIHE